MEVEPLAAAVEMAEMVATSTVVTVAAKVAVMAA